MTENERVLALRRQLGMTLDQFGERLGVRGTAISKIEHSQSTVTDQMRKLICWEFDVNKMWLLTGEGEMFMRVDDPIDALLRKYDLTKGVLAIIKRVLELPPEWQDRLIEDLDMIVQAAKSVRDDAQETQEDSLSEKPHEPTKEELEAAYWEKFPEQQTAVSRSSEQAADGGPAEGKGLRKPA